MIFDIHKLDEFDEWIRIAHSDGAIALIDKESGWTSFDVVAKLRNITKINKVGHSGTLDPLATGLLLIFFGHYTKKVSDYQNLDKAYSGLIKLGAITDTDDAESEEKNLCRFERITNEDLHKAKNKFIGEIIQKPPLYSAKKVNGKRQYQLARKGEISEVRAVDVEIFTFKIIKIELPYIEFYIECSKGTYIRSIARDFGELLGVGGYLYELRRNKIGHFCVDNALTITKFIELFKQLSDKHI